MQIEFKNIKQTHILSGGRGLRIVLKYGQCTLIHFCCFYFYELFHLHIRLTFSICRKGDDVNNYTFFFFFFYFLTLILEAEHSDHVAQGLVMI